MTSAHYGTNAYAAARAGGTDDELIRRYSHVVRRTANHLSSRTGVSADELWSAGALGILEAARRYDPSKGVKLEAFIAYRVRGAMLDELRRMDRLPRRLRNKLAEIDRVRRTLAQQLGREPEREELAAAAGIDASELDRAAEVGAPQASIDDGAPVAAENVDLDTLVVRREQAAALKEAVAQLSERHQMVLSMRYQEELSSKEIAALLGVSEPRICQLHNAAVAKLRAALSR